ncbi:U3 small nucleolar RNA-associated protein 10 [Mycena venus]|uniref:U3 small nucleolar RNA-associated protein 10 n=1 Tax=Mycena venus TaxID=2733690 RepID=A0A8H6U1C5_9AGAR|nr:U3 small nucleolar RNA-associated protein 10 [Mycena venus]
MVSSLAAQLPKGASLNTTLLVDRSRRKAAESYLFTGREADQHDLESIHALGVNGFLQLATLNAAFREFEGPLFSDGSRDTDRTLLSAEAIVQIDLAISGFLSLLGPYLMEAPTGKVLEWLVRRFRINEFNVECLLALFLPYHESPHFAKMLSILHIKPNSTWSFLLPFKAAAQNVPRVSLVTEMLKNSDATRFVVNLLPTAIKANCSHHTLLAFNAATLHDYLTRTQALDEGGLAHLLPALLEPLQQRSEVIVKDAILGSYILLSALAQVCQLTPLALKAIINAMASSARRVATHQFVNAVLSVCEAQEQLDTLTDGTGRSVLRLPNIKEELRSAEKWSGIENFVCPLLTAICRRMDDDAVPSFLEFVINSPTAPTAVLKRLSNLLIIKTVSEDGNVAVRRLLARIQQRHPLIVQEAADEFTSSRAEEEDIQERVDNVVMSLSLAVAAPQASSEGEVKLGSVVASMGVDERARAAAVKELLKALTTAQDGDSVELESIRAALLARVQDTSAIVLNTLYAMPASILPVFLADPKTYVNYLAATLTSSSKPKRPLLRLHLDFLLTHFCPAAAPASIEDVFHKILFPFLLFSKARQHSADLVWEIIAQHPAARYELLAGCADVWVAENGKAGEGDATEKMARLNQAISGKLAENIITSERYAAHFSAVIRKSHEPDPQVRVFAYFVIRALLVRLSGTRQLDAAAQVLEAINLQRLPEVDTSAMDSSQSLPEFLDDAYLGKMVVHKLTSKNTTYWLQVSILTLVPAIPRPTGVLDWFVDESTVDSDGSLHVKLMRAVYKLANSSASVPLITVGLLSELFVHLKDDALAFLAGLWTTCLDSMPELCVMALRHALAFLQAHDSEADGVDFQTILPALVICLQSTDASTRAAALGCIAVQRNLTQQRFSTVYAFDAIYGDNEAKLQYLTQDNLVEYLGAILDHLEHIALDASYIKVIHSQHLSRTNTDKKKDSEYKHNVLCYLLSHVHVLRLRSAQIALLKCIGDISDESKTEVLLPVLLALSQDNRSVQPGSPEEQLASLVLASCDLSASPALNDTKGPLWNVFVAVLQHFLQPGTSTACRAILLQRLEQGLFASLTIDRKVEACNLLLNAGTKDADVYLSSKKLLTAVLHDIPLVVRLLASTKPEANTTPRASKRPKLSEISDDTFPRLSLLAEVLASVPLPGSLDLVSRLLETLHNVVQSTTSADVDISYIEQSLMSAVEHSAEKIREVPNLAPSAIRLDILVDLIRVADNPQTFNQALLLMATLARLAPDSVLHNVMPVFTFMGSNVFHRDDSYSFKVVQKTIDSIVPVMVSSLKNAHTARLDLYLASRDFLRVFTDASNHIPRHRRTSFFGHLVDVLGPADFLPPLCMLLVEKMANRVVRQNPEEVQNSLVLPISVLHRHPPALQIFILTEVLREAQRLTARAADPENLEPSLLDTSPDDDQLQPSAAAFKRRAQALVVFVGYAMKMSPSTAVEVTVPEGGAMSNLVSLLIALATARGGATPDTRIEDVSQAARTSLSKALGCMSAVDFIDAVLSILQSGDARVQGGALDLLSERLHDVASATRLKITTRVNASVEEIRKLLLLHPDGALATSSYKALQSIAATMSPGEENSLTTMHSHPYRLIWGHASFPFFRDIVAQCVALLQEDVEEVATETLNVLHGLLTSIPTFWGPAELTQVSKLYIDHHASSEAPLTTLMKTVAKRAPTAMLISALADMWPSLQVSPQTDRSRPAVQESIRALFNIFLQAFDVGAIATPKSEAEGQTISAFIELVVKLNEASFRPLFRKLYDWAFANETSNLKRKITFCNVYVGLLDYFKGLMNPYMSFLVQPFVATLKDYNAGTLSDLVLWTCILDIFSKSLVSDDGAFWRDDKLRLAAPTLVQQVAVCVRLGGNAEGKALVTECLVAVTDSAADDALLKALNLDLLMHTRSDDARLRVFALACATALWNSHGGKLLAFASETTTFIAECSEDEHDMVVRESLRLKNAMESVAGNITGL